MVNFQGVGKKEPQSDVQQKMPKVKHSLYRGPLGYDPLSTRFWQFLIPMMVLGIFVHLKRVIHGWVMWNECLDESRGIFSNARTDLYYHCFWNDYNGRDGIWRFLHFSGGV